MATKTGDSAAPEPFSLSRWSRRKREIAKADATVASDAAVVAAVAPAPVAPARAPLETGPATAIAPGTPAPATPADALPPVEGLTFDSNFAAFMQPKVAEATKRAALKKLFGDPRFNVMDGLDIYVGDYTQADPMPEGMLEKLAKVYEVIAEEMPAADVDAAPALRSADAAGVPAVPAEAQAAPEGTEVEPAMPDPRTPEPADAHDADRSTGPASSPPGAVADHDEVTLPPGAHGALPAAPAAAAHNSMKRSVPE